MLLSRLLLDIGLLLLELPHLAPGRPVALRRFLCQCLDTCLPLLAVYGLLGSRLLLLLLELSHLAPGTAVALRRPLGERLDMQLPVSINRALARSARLDHRLTVRR